MDRESKEAVAERMQDADYPRYSDLVLAVHAFAALTVSRVALMPVFAVLGRRLVSRQRWGEEHEMRAQRFAGQLWKVLFHGAATAIPLVILRNEAWFAPLPGLGDMTQVFTKHPHIAPVAWLREYYMFQLGYYLHALFVTLLQRGRPNLVSMTVHHAAAIALVFVSYLIQNTSRFGTLTLWLHDVCDVPVSFTRLVVDLSWTVPTLLSYATLIVSWVVFRLVLFPRIVWVASYTCFRDGHVLWSEAYGWVPLSMLLYLLLLMHLMWLAELLGMAKTWLATGKRSDSTESDSVPCPDSVSGKDK